MTCAVIFNQQHTSRIHSYVASNVLYEQRLTLAPKPELSGHLMQDSFERNGISLLHSQLWLLNLWNLFSCLMQKKNALNSNIIGFNSMSEIHYLLILSWQVKLKQIKVLKLVYLLKIVFPSNLDCLIFKLKNNM